jgi:hypothetical protein
LFALGKDVYACSDVLSIADMAKTLSALSGKDVQPLHLPLEVFNSDGLKAKLGDELWDQWDLFVKQYVERGTLHCPALFNPKLSPLITPHVALADPFGHTAIPESRLMHRSDLKRDPKTSRALVQGSWDFKEWAAQNAQLKKVLGY